MSTVVFNYDDWDDSKHSLMDRPGSEGAFAILNSGVDIGKAPSKNQEDRDSTTGPSLQGIVELVAAGIEYCRSPRTSLSSMTARK